MEKNLTVFENEEFGKVRTIEIDGEIWFVGIDVARALGHKNPERAIRKFVDDEDKGVTELVTPGGKQVITIINESGVYAMILSSKTEKAKRFKRWVTSEILPSIRKNGFYATENLLNHSEQEIDSVPEVLIKISIANESKKSSGKKKDLRGKIPIADQQIISMFESMQKQIKTQQEQIEELRSEIQKLKDDYRLLPF